MMKATSKSPSNTITNLENNKPGAKNVNPRTGNTKASSTESRKPSASKEVQDKDHSHSYKNPTSENRLQNHPNPGQSQTQSFGKKGLDRE